LLMMSQKIGRSLRGIYCWNYVIFDVLFDIFLLWNDTWVPARPVYSLRAVYTGVQTTPVYTGAFFAPVYTGRIYGPYIRPAYTGSVYWP